MPLSGLIGDPIGKLGAHDHLALFYETPEERLSVLVPYLKAGLGHGEKCFLAVTSAAAEEIFTGLSIAGVDVGPALNRGALLVMKPPGDAGDAAHAVEPVGLIDGFTAALRQAASERYSALRIAVEMGVFFG